MRVFLVTALALTISTAFAVDPNFIDTFKGASNDSLVWRRGNEATEMWSRPQVRTSHGAGGATDSFLWLQAVGGDDVASRLVMFSTNANWVGNYVTAGVAALQVTVKHLGGDSPVRLYAAFRSTSGSTWASTEPARIYAGTGWQRVVFPLKANSMTHVEGPNTFADAMADVETVRLLGAEDPAWEARPIAVQVGFDDIQLSASSAVSRSLVAVRKWHGCSACAEQSSSTCSGSDSAMYATGVCYTTEHGSERYEYEVDARSVRRYIFDDVKCLVINASTLHSLETCYNTGEAGELEQLYIFESHCQSEEDSAVDNNRLPLITLYENAGCSGSSRQANVPVESCLPAVLSSDTTESLECVGSSLRVTPSSDKSCNTTAESEFFPSCTNKTIGNYASFSYYCSGDIYCNSIDALPWDSSSGGDTSGAALLTFSVASFVFTSLLGLILLQAV